MTKRTVWLGFRGWSHWALVGTCVLLIPSVAVWILQDNLAQGHRIGTIHARHTFMVKVSQGGKDVEQTKDDPGT